MSMHTLMDTFSHSSYTVKEKKKTKSKKKKTLEWIRLKHEDKNNSQHVDNIENRKLRFESAKEAAQKALDKIVVNTKTGLKEYQGIQKTTDLYYAPNSFAKLSKMIKKYIKTGSESSSVKMNYVKEGFALKNFFSYYEAEKTETGKNSSGLEKYKKLVDVEQVQKSVAGMKAIRLIQKQISTLNVYCEDTLEYSIGVEKGQPMCFLVEMDKEYVLKDEDGQKVYRIKAGEMYDTLNRKLASYDETEDTEDDEEEEGDAYIMCAIDEVCPSEECLLKGKIVEFSERKLMYSMDDMPGLEGAEVSLKSRKTEKVYKAKTNEKGMYEIQLPKGIYDVVVEKDETYTKERQYLNVNGDKVTNKTMMLMSEDWTDEGIVDGYVYNTSRKAIAGAKVEMYEGVDYTDGEPVLTLTTDSKGFFSTDFWYTGGYTFVVSKEGYQKQTVYQPVIGYVQSTIKRINLRRASND